MQRQQQSVSNLIAVGIDSALAAEAVSAGYNLTRLKTESLKRLQKVFTIETAGALLEAARRKPIPESILNRLIEECGWHCCICWNIDSAKPVVIHHIEEHARTHDDSYENLVLLCPDHHASAHSRWENARAPHPPEFIRQRKRLFSHALAEFNAGRRVAPGREPHRPESTPVGLAPPLHFCGRSRELRLLREKLSVGSSSAVSIRGMGGQGKTALARKLASDYLTDFAGGVMWTSLVADSGDAARVLRGWIEACGSTLPLASTVEEMVQIVRNLLAERCRSEGRLLVVIDDVRQEWVELAKLLRSTVPAGAAVLITLRDVSIADALDTEPFELDAPSPEDGFDILTAYAGTESVARELTEAYALVEVTGRLPLALELAGKLVRRMDRKQGNHIAKLRGMIAVRAESALQYPGHTGLAATFAITYDTLKPYLKRLFRWLGIFAEAPLELTDIAKVMGISSVLIEERLDELVFTSLLSFGATAGAYLIHPMLHQYARDLLGTTREMRAARRRHLSTYADLSERNATPDPEHDAVLERILPNVTKAIDTAEKETDHVDVCRIAEAYQRHEFFNRRGYLRQGEIILRGASEASSRIGSRRDEGIYMGNRVEILIRQGRTADAMDLARHAISISQQADDRFNRGAYLNQMGQVYLQQGNLEAAERSFLDALGAAMTAKNWSVALDQIGSLGSVCSARGEYERAAKHYRAAAELARGLGDQSIEADSISNLGRCCAIMGDFAQAEVHVSRALSMARELGDLNGEANRLGHLASFHAARGNYMEALPMLEDAIRVAQEAENKEFEGEWTGVKGLILLNMSRGAEAEDCLHFAINAAHQAGRPIAAGKWIAALGTLERGRGDRSAARALFLKALSVINNPRSIHHREIEQFLAELESGEI